MSTQLFDLMAEKGRSALDDDSVYNVYLKLDPKSKALADLMAEKGRSALDDDSVYNVYTQSKINENKPIVDSLRAKAKSDYENEPSNGFFSKLKETSDDVSKIIYPRMSEAEGFVPAAVGGALDIASLPGRATTGLAAGLFDAYKKDIPSGLETLSEVVGRKSSPEGSGVLGFAEDVVKDPLLPLMFTGVPGAIGASVKGFGKAGQWLASHPKTAAGLAAGLTNLGIGATERGVDPTREVYEPGAALAEGVLGFGLGAGGRGVADALSKLGNTEAGRAILKKITPTELRANMDERLAKLIEQGYGVKILDEKGNVDAAKLGNFLSEQSKGTPGTKIERIPDWISSERQRVGKDWGTITDKFSDPIEAVVGQSDAGRKIIGHTTNIDNLIDNIIKNKIKNKQIFSESEALKLKSDLLSLLPKSGKTEFDDASGKVIDLVDPNVTPSQIKDLNQYLYNEAKEMSPRYHRTREEIASDLRHKLQDRQEKIVGEDNIKLAKQYAALSDLENLTGKSNYFNPDRPSTFWQGVKSTASKNIPDRVAPAATEAIQAMIRRGSRTPATPIGGETNQPGMERYSMPTMTDLVTLQGAGKISIQERNAGERALSMLKQNPNDSAAKATIDSLLRK